MTEKLDLNYPLIISGTVDMAVTIVHRFFQDLSLELDRPFRPGAQPQHQISRLVLEPMNAQFDKQRYKVIATFKLFNDRVRDRSWIAVLLFSPLPGKCRIDLEVRNTLLKPRLGELWMFLYKRMQEETVLINNGKILNVRTPEEPTTIPSDYDHEVLVIQDGRDRDMVQMWRNGDTARNIGNVHHLNHWTVYNYLGRLRKEYSEMVVPYKRRCSRK